MPNEFLGAELLPNIAQAESGNRDYDKQGRPVTSPKGARFAMQVMPSTAKNPGFGIEPAKDDSSEESNRVGREYFGKMMEKYNNDKVLALAAYNAGPGNVDEAIAKGGRENFLQYLPKPEETGPYIERVLNQPQDPKSALTEMRVRAAASTDPRTALTSMRAKAAENDPQRAMRLVRGEEGFVFKGSEARAQPEEQEEEGVASILKDLGEDVTMFAGGAAGAAALAGAGVIGTGALPVAVASGLLYGGFKAGKRLLAGEDEEPSLTETLTGQELSPVLRSIANLGEDVMMFGGGAEALRLSKKGLSLVGKASGKTLKGIDLIFHKPAEKLGQKLAPAGEWLWDNVMVLPTKIPVPGTGRNIAEMFQPGVERLAKSSLLRERLAAGTIRKASAMKSLVTEVGRDLSKEMGQLAPRDQYDVLKGLRGTPAKDLKSDAAKQVLSSFDARIKDSGLQKRYEQKFRQELSKALTKPVAGIEGQMQPEQIRSFLGLFEHGLKPGKRLDVKGIHKGMQEMIEHPQVPDEMKVFLKDLWSASAETPKAVADASRKASTSYMTQKLLANPGLISKSMRPGYVQSKWGRLKNLYVPKDVELQLHDISRIPDIAKGFYTKWMLTPWKAAKTIARPAYHIRNTVSNLIMNDWGGLPWYRADVYAQGLKGMRAGSPEWKRFQRLTGAGGSFAQSDIYELEAGMKYGASMFDKMYSVYNSLIAKPASLQNATEQMFKFSKYLHNTQELGMSPAEAALDAVKWTFNYGEITAPTAYLKKYLMPFGTWYTKILPLMAETAVKHPMRFGKWLMFGQALQAHGLEQVGMSGEEWDETQKMLPGYLQNGLYLMMPWRDDQQRLNLMNMTYIMPGIGDLNEITSALSPSRAGPGGFQIQNPFIAILGSLQSLKRYSGAPLYYEWEDPSTKFAKTFGYAWEQLSPAIFPGGTDWNMLWKTVSESEDALTPEQATLSMMGFRLTPVDLAAHARRKEVVQRIHEAEISSQLKKELAGSKSSQETESILRKYQRIREELR